MKTVKKGSAWCVFITVTCAYMRQPCLPVELDECERVHCQRIRPHRARSYNRGYVLCSVSHAQSALAIDGPHHHTTPHPTTTSLPSQTHARSHCHQEWGCIRNQLCRRSRRPRVQPYQPRRERHRAHRETKLVGRGARSRSGHQGQGYHHQWWGARGRRLPRSEGRSKPVSLSPHRFASS